MGVILSVEGLGDVYVENWDEVQSKLLYAIGFEVEHEVRNEIKKSGLISSSEFFQSIMTGRPEGNNIMVYSDAPHALFLEYGTAGRRRGVVDPFGEGSRGPNLSRKMPLRKVGEEFELVPQLARWAKRHGIPEGSWFALAKHIQEVGLEPYAPFRRVVYNDSLMRGIVQKGFDAATKQ